MQDRAGSAGTMQERAATAGTGLAQPVAETFHRRVLVCGGRDYMDSAHVWSVLNEMHNTKPIGLIIQGGAFGADTWAMTWGHSAGVPVIEYVADWKKHGNAAGPIRNAKMLEDGKPDLVVAFPGGKGTTHMIKLARYAGIPVYIEREPE